MLLTLVLFIYLQKDSESDYDESSENPPLLEAATAAAANSSTTELNTTPTAVKAELIDYSLPAKMPEIEKIQSVFGESFPFEDNMKEDTSSDIVVVKEEVKIEIDEVKPQVAAESLVTREEEKETQMETNSEEAEKNELVEVTEPVQENGG